MGSWTENDLTGRGLEEGLAGHFKAIEGIQEGSERACGSEGIYTQTTGSAQPSDGD